MIRKADRETKFFEAAPGEKSLSAVIAFGSFLASVWFGHITLQLSAIPGASPDIGVWLTSIFLGAAGGIKLGRSGIAAWSDVAKRQITTDTEDCGTTTLKIVEKNIK